MNVKLSAARRHDGRHMQSLIAAVAAAALLQGACSTYGGSRKVATTGGIMILTGLVLVTVGSSMPGAGVDDDPGFRRAFAVFGTGVLVGGVGLLLGLSGMVGMQLYPKPLALPSGTPSAAPVSLQGIRSRWGSEIATSTISR